CLASPGLAIGSCGVAALGAVFGSPGIGAGLFLAASSSLPSVFSWFSTALGRSDFSRAWAALAASLAAWGWFNFSACLATSACSLARSGLPFVVSALAIMSAFSVWAAAFSTSSRALAICWAAAAGSILLGCMAAWSAMSLAFISSRALAISL